MAKLYQIDGVWEGRKIRILGGREGSYMFYNPKNGCFYDERDELVIPCFNSNDWEPYTELKQKRKIKLYRYTYEVISRHVIYQSNFSDESWNQYIKDSTNLKLLHTEEKEITVEVDND